MLNRYFFIKCCRISLTTKTLFKMKNPNFISQSDFSTFDEEKRNKLVLSDPFQDVRNKNKNTYLEMLDVYKMKEIHRRGHVEFIYSALKYMKEFGVEKDLDVYKALIDVLPKGKMIPRNMFQVEFMHYPKQQQCAIDLLEQMEENGVMPDWNMEDQLVNVFGNKGYPVRRYWRMMYWMPKFKNASPWLLPNTIPSDTCQLAELAIERICSVDITSQISIFKTTEVEDSIDDTWIVSGQSADQRDILSNLQPSTPVHVEGGFRIWLKNRAVSYFILRADQSPELEEEQNYDDVGDLKIPLFSKPTSIVRRKTIHEQPDGTILAVCATGTSSKDSLLSWVRILQKCNPNLINLTVLFHLKSQVEQVLPIGGIQQENKPIAAGTS